MSVSSTIHEPNFALNSAPQHMNYPYTEVCIIFFNFLFCNITFYYAKLYRMTPGHLTQTYQPLSIGTSVLPTVGPLTTTSPALETVLLATGQQSRLQPKGRIMPAIPNMVNAQQDIDCKLFILNFVTQQSEIINEEFCFKF